MGPHPLHVYIFFFNRNSFGTKIWRRLILAKCCASEACEKPAELVQIAEEIQNRQIY